jgi:hypothetical protein
MPLIMRSTRSAATGRLRSAISTERVQLVAVERRAAAVLLHHRQFAQLHALEGGEAAAAIGTNAAAADRRGILGRPRVLHLRIETAAIGQRSASAK